MDNFRELDLNSLYTHLRSTPIGHTVDYHRTIDSTMPRAHELAQDPAIRAGQIIVSEEQTAGKGRRGRVWNAPYARALLVSIILKPPLLPKNPAQIPMAAGIALTDALVKTVPALRTKVSLKWPNDVLLETPAIADGVAGKVAGILSESAFDTSRPLYAILGLGINVNQTQDELPDVELRMTTPISLRSVLGKTVDRTDLLVNLCRQLAKQFDPEREPDTLFDEWRSRLSMLGKSVTVYVNTGPISKEVSGIAIDVLPSGELLIEDREGHVQPFTAADVSIRSAT